MTNAIVAELTGRFGAEHVPSVENVQDATSKIIEEKLHDVNQKITTTSIIKIGKKKFIKVVI
jgi:hypothetical protein